MTTQNHNATNPRRRPRWQPRWHHREQHYLHCDLDNHSLCLDTCTVYEYIHKFWIHKLVGTLTNFLSVYFAKLLLGKISYFRILIRTIQKVVNGSEQKSFRFATPPVTHIMTKVFFCLFIPNMAKECWCIDLGSQKGTSSKYWTKKYFLSPCCQLLL
jgi:hypothetical protein